MQRMGLIGVLRQHAKRKIYCECGLCKFDKKYGLPTIKGMREKSREKILMKD